MTTAGAIFDGTSDAYDTAFRLQVGPEAFPAQDQALTSEDGRELFLGPALLGGLTVTRRIYVPELDQFVRYLEVFDNPGDVAVEVPVSITGNLGSDGATTVIGDASGDLMVDAADAWFATDDNGSDPALGFSSFGDGAAVTPTVQVLEGFGGQDFRYDFDLVVEPGARVILMHFALQRLNAGGAIADAPTLAEPDAGMLMSIDPEDLAAIANYPVVAD